MDNLLCPIRLQNFMHHYLKTMFSLSRPGKIWHRELMDLPARWPTRTTHMVVLIEPQLGSLRLPYAEPPSAEPIEPGSVAPVPGNTMRA